MRDYKEIMKTMRSALDNAYEDLERAECGNKAAAKRLRKFTVNMGNHLGKDFRRLSIKFEKEEK